MSEDELGELIQLLGRSGLRAELCDTRVPLSGSPVRCGTPTEPGDADLDDYVLLPKALVGAYPEMFIPAQGDSMRDAGYEEGDRLRVQFGVTVHDGDNVLASIDGCCTVKTYCTDEEGQQWLVPRNEAYDAIRLTDDMDVRLLGRVVGVEKASPRTAFRDCMKAIRRTKGKMRTLKRLAPEQVDGVVAAMGAEVRHARQWYAVYRALADQQVADGGGVSAFCQRVARLLPAHGHLPDARELSRMAVQSFSKPVALWTEANAPVSGARFADYLRIARLTGERLEELTPAKLPQTPTPRP